MAFTIEVNITCKKCGQSSTVDVTVPAPNYSYEKISDSTQFDTVDVECPHCGTVYEAEVTIDMGHNASCTISELGVERSSMVWDDEDLWDYDRQEFDWSSSETEQLTTFCDICEKTKAIIESNSVLEDHSFDLHVMAFGHVVSAFEGFLFSTFIHNTLSDEQYIKKYVEHSELFTKQKLTFADAYLGKINLLENIKEEMRKTIFHNLDKTVPMYKNVFGYKFKSESKDFISGIVTKRHDCAHRAGYTKDNQRIDVSKEEIV
jgi:transcription elongation factor Elf1